MTPRAILLDLFHTAVAAAQASKRLPLFLPPPPRGRTIVIGAGKAAAEMAAQLEAAWPGPLEGVVVTRYGHAVPCRRIRVLEAAHPFPDENGVAAARAMRAALAGLGPDDLVISLMSGGGSALLVEPPPGVSLADKRQLTRDLFQAGATIRELNRVRQALSLVKGGQLAAAAWPARVLTLVISDVPGDDPALVASGPTVAPSADPETALAIAERLGVALPARVRAALAAATAVAGDFAHCRTELIATPMQSLRAAAARARELGFTPLILSDCIEGEAREVAEVHAGIALSALHYGEPLAGPAILLSGGETKVSFGAVTPGRGGRNVEFLLALGLALRGERTINAIACDTDGVDGSEDNAGALWLADSAERARAGGVDLRGYLDRHDAYGAFAALDDLVVCGPTHTNVNDFRAIMIA
jgi:hydroxypyruvate reductase